MKLRSLLTYVKLPRGMVLYYPGDAIENVYFPLAGMVTLIAAMKSGHQVETGIVGRSGIVGATIGSIGPLAFGQTIVQIEGAAYQLSRANFLMMFEISVTFRSLVLEYDGFLYFQAMQSAACHAIHSVEARLCRWMLQSQDVLQTQVVGLTQDSLAILLGVQRAAVSLCAHQMQAAGLIKYSRGNIRILSRDGLAINACECYGATRQFIQGMASNHKSIKFTLS